MMPDIPPHADATAAGGVIAAKPNGAARRALLRRLMDVVALPSSRGNMQDRAIAGDLLLEMLIESDVSARELCARRLQEMSQAPKRLLRYLALDAPHVAQVILAENKAFDDADLCYIVEHGQTPHRVAVAHRRDSGPAVSSAIAASGDVDAMKVLLDNPQSRLSDRAVELLVDASRTAPALPPMLIQREEVRPAHALAMFWWSGPHERQQILLRFSAERTLLLDMCGDVFRQALEDSDPVVRKSLQVIERRQRDRAAIERSDFDTLESAIDAAAVAGLTPESMAEIAGMCGVKVSTAERIFNDRGGEGVAVLCKATGLKRKYLRTLWEALRRPEDGDDFIRVSGVYETIAVAKAQTVLRYWNWSLISAFALHEFAEAETAAMALHLADDAPAAVLAGRMR
jgi:uncharacterized protein (DUF2336 family)